MKNFPVTITLNLLLGMLFLSIGAQAQIKGWGNGTTLGIGTQDVQSSPVMITSVPDATDANGYYQHAVFAKADGTVFTTGINCAGSLGNGLTDGTQYTPAPVLNLTNVTQVAAGWCQSFALRSDGTVWGWGHNSVGQLGTGANSTNACGCIPTPAQAAISNVVQFDAGADFTLALKSDGTVWAWGFNRYGQLGNNSTVNSPTPVQVGVGVTGFNNLIAVSAGEFHSMALKSDGTVWTWGNNGEGETGNGTFGDQLQLQPVQNTTISDVRQIASGSSHNIAIKTDGSIWIWGSSGQIGNGSGSQGCCVAVPQRNTTMANVIDVKSEGQNTLTKLNDGSIWAWGVNTHGQMGNGTVFPNTGQLTPVQSSVGAGNALIASSFFSNYAGNPLSTTPTGANVRRFGRNVSLTFSSVTATGTTGYMAIDPSATGLNVPKGYTIQTLAPAYNVTTTAATSGKSYVCLNVPSEYNQTQFALLKILHEEGSNLVDRTVSSTYIKRRICAGAETFGRFVVAKGTTPTTGSFVISGRVLDASGRVVSKATVLLTDEQGNKRASRTNGFGYFMFEAVAAAETYTFTISGKGNVFSPQTITVHDESEVLTFTAQ